MRRWLTVSLAAALCVMVASLTLAGCGESKDKQQAKEYMNAGDEKYSQASKVFAELQQVQTSALTELKDATPEKVQEFEKKLSELGDQLNGFLLAALEEYDKIQGLNDVEDYKNYAQKMKDVIYQYQAMIEKGTSVKEKIVNMILSGQPIDTAAMMQDPDLKALMDMQSEIQKMEKEAKAYKTDKKLAE